MFTTLEESVVLGLLGAAAVGLGAVTAVLVVLARIAAVGARSPLKLVAAGLLIGGVGTWAFLAMTGQ